MPKYVTATATARVSCDHNNNNEEDIISFSAKISRKSRDKFSTYCRATGMTQNEALMMLMDTHCVVTKEFYQEQINALKALRDDI